ncbi:helix-turn-helix domain-containing protein [Microtetraspora malaysiensis]|uniref:helix-turn-helix domain-containing protein n=1 Tax=Microtetraspora malaysiensis TaxID=161358 RepID=UPI003D8DA88E
MDGKDNKRVAAELRVHPDTVSKWRSRFLRLRLDGARPSVSTWCMSCPAFHCW